MMNVAALINAMGLPTALLTPDATIAAMNPAAASMVVGHSALRQESGMLKLRREDEVALFSDALRRVVSGDGPERTTLMLRSRGGRPVLMLRLAAMQLDGAPFVLCEMANLEAELSGAAELANILGLTKGQANVVSHLARGLNVPEMMELLDLKETTLRTHIREACARLGLGGQHELALCAAQVGRLAGLFGHG
jgi:DNA-binding CsgD family transcriptional regulator